LRRGKCVKQVLIPLGRSLQRDSAAPDYFGYPRAVVAVDGEPGGPGELYVKDRLYLGYQEKANLIEVISYNEDAGRFEFQVVTDYRAGGTPQVVANRAVCTACHRSRRSFPTGVGQDNANPKIAARGRGAEELLRHSVQRESTSPTRSTTPPIAPTASAYATRGGRHATQLAVRWP
jgi:hypothetical protein